MKEIGVIILIGEGTTADDKPHKDLDFIINTFSEIFERTARISVVINTYTGPITGIGLSNSMHEIALHLKSVLTTNHSIAPEFVNVIRKCKSLPEVCYYSKIIVDSSLPDVVDLHLINGRMFNKEFIKELFEQIFHTPAYNMQQHHPINGFSSQNASFTSDETLKDSASQALANFAKGLPSFDKHDITILTSSVIPSLFSHGFSTRFGGISTNKFISSLNLSFQKKKKDPKFCTDENRRRFANACCFEQKSMKFPKCRHNAAVWIVGVEKEPESYDAMVTKETGVTLVAPGADCATLLFCDPINKVCAAAHAGWKGILAEIGKAVIESMKKQFHSNPTDIKVAIGPSIGPCCYEVGEDVSKPFIEKYGNVIIQFQEGKSKPHLDLRLAIRLQLEECGVIPDSIDDGTRHKDNWNKVTICTFCDPEKQFFSYRRDKITFGTHVGFINMNNT